MWSAEEEPHENIEPEIDDNNLYHIYNMTLDDKKENTEWLKRAFQSKLENTYDIESHNGITCIYANKVNKSSEFNLLHYILNPF